MGRQREPGQIARSCSRFYQRDQAAAYADGSIYARRLIAARAIIHPSPSQSDIRAFRTMREIERMLSLLKRPTRLWRVDEAAFLCDKSPRTIYRAIKARKIKPRNKRIPHSEVVRYCGGRDPLHEFALSIRTLDDGTEFFLKRIAELQAKVEELQRACH